MYGLNGEDSRIQVHNLDSSIAHRPTGLQGRRTEIHAFAKDSFIGVRPDLSVKGAFDVMMSDIVC